MKIQLAVTAAALLVLLILAVLSRVFFKGVQSTRTAASFIRIHNKTSPAIPHILYFTHKDDILGTKTPLEYYNNVQNTIDLYKSAWNDPQVQVHFLLDDDCRRILGEVHPDLLVHFENERQGMYRADLCRVAALYVTGGYYFDTDLQVVEPFVPDDSVKFMTVESPWGTTVNNVTLKGLFFQAFLATEPNSTILEEAMDVMDKWYKHEITYPKGATMGTSTLRYAYDSVPPEARNNTHILKEHNLEEMPAPLKNITAYRDFPRQNGFGCCCNYVVHDPDEKQVYFYSRLLTHQEASKCSTLQLCKENPEHCG